MNCPSRTDDTLKHKEWHQNPPRFAPDLTTRQDLIGISNAREDQSEAKGPDILGGGSNCPWQPSLGKNDDRDDPLLLGGASLTKSGIGKPSLSSSRIDVISNNFHRTPRLWEELS